MADIKLDVKINVDADQAAIRAIQKEISGVEKSLNSLESTGAGLSSSLGRITEIFTGAFAAQVAVAGISSLINSIEGLGKAIISDGITSAEEFESALNNFNIALASSGGFTKEASDAFVEYADTVEKSTGIADDAILRTAALLSNVTGATGEDLKGVTQATIDLSAAMQIDLETAARLVGKAVEGTGESLKKYGIEVEKGKNSTEQLGNVVDAISAKFGGVAAQQINTFAGAVRLNSNAFEDFTKAIGQTITQNQTVIGVIKAVANEFGNLENYVKANQQEIKVFISEGIILASNALLGLINVLDILGRAFNIVQNSISIASQVMALAVTELAEIILKALQQVVQFLPGFSDSFDQAVSNIESLNSGLKASIATDYADIQESISGTSTAFDVLEPAIQRVKSAAEEGFGAVQSGASSSVEPINQSKGAIDQMNASLERQKQLQEENKKLVEEGNRILEQSIQKDPNKKYDEELKALDAAQAAKLEKEDAYNEAILAKNADNKAKIQEQEIAHQEAIDAINLEFDTARAEAELAKEEALAAQNQKKLDDLVARNEVLKQIDEQRAQDEIAANQKAIDGILKSEDTSQKTKDKYRLDQKKKDEEALRNKLQLTQEFFGNLASLTETNSRALFNIGKKAALAEAIVQGALAIQKALGSAPPPFNYALAAAVAVKTGVNISQIQQQQFAKGTDFVQGPGGIDNVPALLTRGERVISKQGNEDLTTFLTDNSSQNEILLEISAKLERLSPSVTVEIGGKEIANVIREQTRAGRVIA